MEYETWFDGNIRLIAADPTLPMDFRNYTNLKFVDDGPPIAHAVAAGSSRPECGTDNRVLPYGYPWSDPIPNWWQRCPHCVTFRTL
ncbi:hypothetical protein [Nocardia barduliensis]|uniref:hypothetical protein n=1 Tax=Nocardia barduliensis TaxID=2736643 RepID=UPI001572701A|nr:hypothetical protein [Nocardia barduliensis]